jgi:hypothetical protein
MDQPGFDDQGRPVPVTGFDYQAVEAGGHEPEQQDGAAALPLTGDDLLHLLEWLSVPELEPVLGREVYLRVVAVAWVLRPEVYGGRSLRALARQIGVSKSALGRHAAAVSRNTGVQNGAQSAHARRRKGPSRKPGQCPH